MKINLINFRGIPQNYGIVDNVLSRSAQPTKEDFATLKEQGITDIIDLRTHLFEPKSKNFDEEETVQKLGMNYHNIQSYTRQPSTEKINKFLDIVEQTGKKGGKAHVHCQAGADRTGMYVFIYKWAKGIGTIQENIEEWIKYGQHKDIYPNLIEDTQKLVTTQNIKIK